MFGFSIIRPLGIRDLDGFSRETFYRLGGTESKNGLPTSEVPIINFIINSLSEVSLILRDLSLWLCAFPLKTPAP